MIRILPIILLLFGLTALPASALTLQGIRDHQSSDGKWRVVFDVDAKPSFETTQNNRQSRLVLNIHSVQISEGIDFNLKETPSARLASYKHKRNQNLSLVFNMDDQTVGRAFYLSPAGSFGHRLIVDFQKQPRALRVTGKRHPGDIIIAVDAGHGGRDPGALGVGGRQEKHVTLAIAKKLVAMINQHSDISALLIRSSDVHINLKDRIKRARKFKADYLISIHGDAHTNAAAKGASIYMSVRQGDVPHETASHLARQANHDGLIAQLTEGETNPLKEVVVNMAADGSQAAAYRLAMKLLRALSKVTQTRGTHVKRDKLAVLEGFDIPSILIETGFISNPDEAKLLYSDTHQTRLAKAISDALVDFARESLPPDVKASRQSSVDRNHIYTIVQGDTLADIAKSFKVSTESLLLHNKLPTEHRIRAGEVLSIP